MRRPFIIVFCLSALPHTILRAAERIAEGWDYAPAMREVAARSKGQPGVVLHIGDSMTYANPYGQWARLGAGKTDDDKAALAWMHTGADNELDGWWLARVDLPGGRSHTAAGGLRLDELLAGGKAGLPSLSELIDRYRPQAIVLMIGTNDAIADRGPARFQSDLLAAVKISNERGVVPLVSTIPPHPGKPELARRLNDSIRDVARRQRLPLIDLEKEILTRRPDDWNGTLLNKDDMHLSANHGQPGQPDYIDCAAAPADENLRQVGYLLRGWLSVRKLAEVKRRVFDGVVSQTPSSARPDDGKAPSGAVVRLDVTRDTWFSNVGQEADGNNGGADRLKVKSIQEMSLVDFDAAPLRGRLVRSAALHLRPRGPEIVRRVTVGTISADSNEGTASGYEPQPGSSCFNWRHYPGVPWAYPGSNLCEVILGRGGSRWRTADASPPAQGGWQTIAIDPRVVAARVARCSFGLFVFDDTGSEWSRNGDQFKLHLFPNRFLHSRESGRQNAPYLTVELGESDDDPPHAPSELVVETAGLPPGEASISWLTPKDEGPGETLGFHATLDGEPLPRYLLPVATDAGKRVTMHLRDVPFHENAELAVWAVDSAGNEGPPERVRLPGPPKVVSLLPPRSEPANVVAQALPKFAGAEVAIIDPLDKVAPVAKKVIPEQPSGYLRLNHLWNADTREIHLYAAKNEVVGFQLWVNGNVPNLMLTTSFSGPTSPARVEWSRLYPIRAGQMEICDAAVPLSGLGENGTARVFVDQRPPEWPSALEHGSFLSEAGGALLCEIYVPHDTQAGEYTGELLIGRRGSWLDELRLKLRLTVWDFILPDYLSFLPEMNCYDLPDNERDYYRLAHRHRTFLNRVPYHQNGSVSEGCAPEWDGKRLHWEKWDKRFAPYLDGSAFADLPRSGVPIEGFYLPWHENWPSPMEGSFNGDYWADRAFPERYRRALVEVARQSAEHFNERGWHDTIFQGFLNNKNNFKDQGWSHGSSPWLLDEPANFQDYWALAWFGQAFHEGVDATRGRAKLLYRCDISRPEWQRDVLDDVLDYNVVGGAMRRYRRMVLDRKQELGQVIIEYGSANSIDKSNVQPAAWCIDAWSLGADGVLPWQTVGNDQSWEKADTLSLFYPGKPAGHDKPIPSLRLKAFCRGQQDVEYLTLFSRLKQAPRWQLGDEVRKWLALSGQRRASGVPAAEDAGVIQYDALKPRDLWELRMAVGKVLSAAHPAAQRRLVEFNVPTRPVRPLSDFVAGSDEK